MTHCCSDVSRPQGPCIRVQQGPVQSGRSQQTVCNSTIQRDGNGASAAFEHMQAARCMLNIGMACCTAGVHMLNIGMAAGVCVCVCTAQNMCHIAQNMCVPLQLPLEPRLVSEGDVGEH